jgi:hypothetical protein
LMVSWKFWLSLSRCHQPFIRKVCDSYFLFISLLKLTLFSFRTFYSNLIEMQYFE